MPRLVIFAAGLVAFAILVAGKPSYEDGRVKNGTVMKTPVPYLVSMTQAGEHFCGGFIYNENYVVTAASCVYNMVPHELNVTVAQVSLIQLDPDEKTLPVFAIHIHKRYDNKTKVNDIAMLELENPIVFGTNVDFIPYGKAEEETLPSSNISTEFYGWGNSVDGGVSSFKLRMISLTMISPNFTNPNFTNCNRVYTDAEFNALEMLCAGDSSIDTGSPCHYDEGSPLVQIQPNGTSFAIGIMSKNKGCPFNFPFEPTVFTRLNFYSDWLNEIGGKQPI